MRVLVVGDFCPMHRVAELFDKDDFASVLGDVKPIIEQTDYSIVNFECPVCRGGEVPIIKYGPNLSCSEKGLEAVKWAGFNCVTLANNHFLDYGVEGVDNTLAACKKYGIDTVGGGTNLKEASQILYKEIGGRKLAIINCCEHEFSIASETTAGSNPLNPVQQYYAIKKAKENADYVLVIVHGGHEHFQLPSLRIQEIYRFFVEAGADAVVNHHQHCYSGYEIYKGKPIFYGLGNFCFDWKGKQNPSWYEGYMVELDFDGNQIKYSICPYVQCENQECIQLVINSADFDTSIKKLNSIIVSENELKRMLHDYYENASLEYELMLQPYENRLLSKLFRLHLFSSMFSINHISKILNRVECESHYEKFLYTLKKILSL